MKLSVIAGFVLFLCSCSPNGEPVIKDTLVTEKATIENVIQDTTSLIKQISVQDTTIEPYQVPWLYYTSPKDLSLLRLHTDTLLNHFKYRNYRKQFKIPSWELAGRYYMLSPDLQDAVFQAEDKSMHIYPQEVMDEAYFFSYETPKHFNKGLFAITAFKKTALYLLELYYLTYSTDGKLIGAFVLAETDGDGGYVHEIEGYFKNDSTYINWGKGSEADDSKKGFTAFSIDTAVYVISSDGKVKEIKKRY